jgi:magnesium-transporting ATPase (P-type)
MVAVCALAAGMDILCSDKTGTLTLNKLSIDLAAAYPIAGKRHWNTRVLSQDASLAKSSSV